MTSSRRFISAATFAVLLVSGIAYAQAVNLYQDVLSHKAAIMWMATGAPKVPADVCASFKACTGAQKAFVMLNTKIDGANTGRALFLADSKDPQHPDVILAHQTSSEAYYFLISPDGNLKSTAWKEPGKAWQLIGNSLGQSKFDRDKKDWHDWASKLGAAKP